MGDVTERFTDRVENYTKYRPSYPREAIDHIVGRGVAAASTVAEVGSGTGILSEILLGYVRRLYAVEPNDAMRSVAEERLSGNGRFVSVKATAEETTLPDSSVDAVFAAQAFHWFDREAALREFRRILTGPRLLVLMWNDRLRDTPFLEDYERVLQTCGTDYRTVNHRHITDESLEALFASDYRMRVFDNEQRFDLTGLKGRLFSSSYTPNRGESGYDELVRGVEEAFRRHNRDGLVSFRYALKVYSGRL